jgi:hypothetical protein
MKTKQPHPEDEIYRVKTFVKELTNVQEKYFDDLCAFLKLNKTGEDFLFDYIHNAPEEYDGFDHYLEEYGKTFKEMVKN